MANTKTSRTTPRKPRQNEVVDSDEVEVIRPHRIRQPLDHLRSRKKQVYLDVSIPDDGAYLVARDDARSKVAQLDLRSKIGRDGQRQGNEELEEAKEALARAEDELEPHLLWFRATGLPPKKYDALVSEHPPTADQRKEAKKDGISALAYNPDTFLNELVIRCVTFAYVETEDGEIEAARPPFPENVQFEPISQAFMDEMREDGQWVQGEIAQLWEAAANVNQNIRRVGTLGNG